MAGPLDGIRVLDLTSVGYGPYACQILGDYGAEVVKVESHEGDITRGISPFRNEGMGHFFIMANRNKRCIVLDLKTERGREACLKLVEDVDVIISSIRPAAMDRLGLGYDDCRAVNEKIIYVALVGFGQSGPYAKRPAYDDIIQGLSGMAAMQGGRDGPPKFVNASVCDKICSQVAAHATLAALFSRERTAQGQMVEVPMFESMVGFNLVEHHSGQAFEPALGPAGYERSMVEYRRPYATADGYICALPYNTKQWRAFFKIMDRNDMMDDPRVIDPKVRSEKIGELYELVANLVKDWKTADLLAALEEGDIPHGVATGLDDLSADPHMRDVGFFQTFDHPTEGGIKLTAPPVKFSETPPDIRRLPALLGEHSVEVLKEAGYSDDQITEFMADGISVDGRI
ncbi:MAG: CoA transferase [Rhodospirillaceae bacterium]|jgi:crotonobetainyl-CoA:carnitine CoA-transferase CaiB-like acyl-CoA transferase|nr:CoA transferase [Rhodospirillaceae bacterium]MBT4046339.1 CoA transferase [Rhodospirillaceae bacterium]MBT4690793.1 CoA transferase [Rhodospirillaceae bacterium]MBT5080533.1 CoA transferase [Rhodospirillaceae bacterium]MBT5526598.1 CoA transferase [Rhodospirillaceae bacterium]